MKKSLLVLNFVLVSMYLLLGLVSTAHAYLDPGTGSFILQMLVASLLGVLLYIKLAWTSVKAFFYRVFSRGPRPQVEQEEEGDEKL